MNLQVILFTIGMTILFFYLAIKSRKSNHPKAKEAEKRFLGLGFAGIIAVVTSILATIDEYIKSIGGGL